MKPFTSKHCAQYLTKSSPFRQIREAKKQEDSKLKEQFRPKIQGIVSDPRTFNIGKEKYRSKKDATTSKKDGGSEEGKKS
jgi:hypothetical protein